MRTPILAVQVQLPLEWKNYLLFNFDIVNFVRKTNEGETESIFLLVFVLWQCFNRRWVMDSGCCRKSYIGPAEIASFSKRDFSRSNKYGTFWHAVPTGYFYVLFLWDIAITDFCPLEINKNLSLPLSTITFTVNSHANNYFYKYNCFKYYTVWNHVFLLKYMLRFFMYKFDFNVRHSFYFFL